ELLRHCLCCASPAIRVEVAPHPTCRHWQVGRVMLAKQIYEIALDNNPGTPRFHGTCNALVDVNIGTDAAKRDTGAKAADRSAYDRNGEVGLRPEKQTKKNNNVVQEMMHTLSGESLVFP